MVFVLAFVNHMLVPRQVLHALGDDDMIFPLLPVFWDQGFVYAIASAACEFLYLFFFFLFF